MKDIYLNFPAFRLGSQRRTLAEAEAANGLFSAASALEDAGFGTHHVCPEGESAYDLARGALDDMLTTYPETRDLLPKIDLILYVTCLPLNGNNGDVHQFESSRDVKHLMDFPASRLQADFGMDNAYVMGINQQACTGMLGSIRVASAMLEAEPDMQHILCITADRFPAGAAYEQAYNLISDGGAACIVSREARGYRFLGAHHITNGAMATANDEETAGFYFSYSHRMITELCRKAGITPADVQWIVPQNTNRKAWRILSSVLRFDFQRILMPTIGTAGHCISGDNIINLKTVQAEGRIQPGDKILLPMAGFGLNWSCILLEKVAD
ncbi:MAG: 3-oxoacyl-[acyl-carrier-protein] synthase III C-terminal domain-containing protein [Pseudomonadota bacterium]